MAKWSGNIKIISVSMVPISEPLAKMNECLEQQCPNSVLEASGTCAIKPSARTPSQKVRDGNRYPGPEGNPVSAESHYPARERRSPVYLKDCVQVVT